MKSDRFGIFKKECEKWINIYGLHGWNIRYNTMQDENNSGLCEFDLQNKMSTISLNTEKSEKDIDPKLIAFHEVTELLLSKIRYLSSERFIQPDEVDEELHTLIRVLENVLWKNYK
jgi:hypothetical protein